MPNSVHLKTSFLRKLTFCQPVSRPPSPEVDISNTQYVKFCILTNQHTWNYYHKYKVIFSTSNKLLIVIWLWDSPPPPIHTQFLRNWINWPILNKFGQSSFANSQRLSPAPENASGEAEDATPSKMVQILWVWKFGGIMALMTFSEVLISTEQVGKF